MADAAWVHELRGGRRARRQACARDRRPQWTERFRPPSEPAFQASFAAARRALRALSATRRSTTLCAPFGRLDRSLDRPLQRQFFEPFQRSRIAWPRAWKTARRSWIPRARNVDHHPLLHSPSSPRRIFRDKRGERGVRCRDLHVRVRTIHVGGETCISPKGHGLREWGRVSSTICAASVTAEKKIEIKHIIQANPPGCGYVNRRSSS